MKKDGVNGISSLKENFYYNTLVVDVRPIEFDGTLKVNAWGAGRPIGKTLISNEIRVFYN